MSASLLRVAWVNLDARTSWPRAPLSGRIKYVSQQPDKYLCGRARVQIAPISQDEVHHHHDCHSVRAAGLLALAAW